MKNKEARGFYGVFEFIFSHFNKSLFQSSEQNVKKWEVAQDFCTVL